MQLSTVEQWCQTSEALSHLLFTKTVSEASVQINEKTALLTTLTEAVILNTVVAIQAYLRNNVCTLSSTGIINRVKLYQMLLVKITTDIDAVLPEELMELFNDDTEVLKTPVLKAKVITEVGLEYDASEDNDARINHAKDTILALTGSCKLSEVVDTFIEKDGAGQDTYLQIQDQLRRIVTASVQIQQIVNPQ